jgi:PAS domain S-box-containing protein
MKAPLIFPAQQDSDAPASAAISDSGASHPWDERSHERLSHFFDLSFSMLCIIGFDGRFKLLNSAWESALGFSEVELLATPFIEFVHPEDRALTFCEEGRIVAGSRAVCFEIRCRCKEGSYRWLLWNQAALLDQQVIYAAARDVTDCKQMEDVASPTPANHRP